MKIKPDISAEEFFLFLTKDHVVEENGRLKIHNYRFGRSIWLKFKQDELAKFTMTSKKSINDLVKKTIDGGYIEYVGLSTYQMTEKSLKLLEEWRNRPYPPSDYKEFVNNAKQF